MKVLILEDARIGGRVLQALGERGLEGRWFVSVKAVSSEELTGVGADGRAETICLAEFGMALVDGFLLLDGLMGWDVLPSLKPRMFTVGTSSAGEIGAHTAIEKSCMVDELDHLLDSAANAAALAS